LKRIGRLLADRMSVIEEAELPPALTPQKVMSWVKDEA
jgi:hypothetical protein